MPSSPDQTDPTTAPRRTGLRGFLLATLGVGLAAGFLTFIVTVSISPLSDWTQEVGACPGAERVVRDVSSGGTAPRPGAPTGNPATNPRGATTVFTLECTYPDEVRLIGNDEAVLKGFLVGFGIGFLPAALLYALWRGGGRLRGRDEHAPSPREAGA
jgi:hypothetical protein